MGQKPKFIAIGYTNIDINITSKGETILPGGAAYFVALAASRIVKKVGLVTRVGYDFDPSFLFTRVLKEGIHIIPDKETARSIQTYHSETDLTDRDIKLEWGVAPDVCFGDIPKSWTCSIKAIHIGTMPPKQQQKILKSLKKALPHVQVSIDTDQSFLNSEENTGVIIDNFNKSDIVFVNRVEFKKLKQHLIKHPFVIGKKDKDGAFIMKHGRKIMEIESPIVRVVDVTGAGDIFAGTFLGSQSNGESLQVCLENAIATASESVTKQGMMHLF